MTSVPKRFPPGTPLRDRLLGRSIINLETGCWEWQGSKNHKGYGLIREASSNKIAHRVAYGLIEGPIPDGLHLDHLCRVRHCINPAHLEPVTNRENLMRSPATVAAKRAAQTHCIHGHEFTPENTTIRKSDGCRECRTCRRALQRKYNAQRKAARQEVAA